ncbi:MAG: caspase family protein [Bradyrhizobium sp.]
MRRVIGQVGRLLSGTILLIVAILTVTGPAAADKRVALVIGNSIHEHAPLLDEPAADARLLAERLGQLGFTLSGGGAQIDLDRKGFDRAIAEFKGRAADADIALIYYAGYGLNLNGTNYLVPVDAAPAKAADLDTELRDLNAVLREIDGSSRRQNVVILDAFRSNPFEARGIAGLAAGLAPMHVPARTMMSFAAQPGTVGQRGPDGHGVFAAALAEALQQTDRRLIEIFNQTDLAVGRLTKGAQQPFVMFTMIDGGTPWSPIASKPATSVASQPTPLAGTTPAQPGESAAQDARTAGLAVLYDEDPTDPKGRRYPGSVTWRTETIKDAQTGASTLVIRADIDVPERKMKLTIQLRQNRDPSMPASHIADVTFRLGPDFPGGGVSSLPGILMKTDEKSRGTPLAGLAVKVTEGSFLVGLSNVVADRERNEQLLGGREWFDIPLVYMNQRRGILAIAKGPGGDKVFADAFAAWSMPATGKSAGAIK